MKWLQDKETALKKLQEMRKNALVGSSISLATVSGVLSTKTNLVKYASSELGFDLVTTKSFQVIPNSGNREPIICQPEPFCFGNSVGLRNPGIDVAVKELEALRQNFEMKSLLKNLNKLELILNELEAQPINLKFDPFDPLSIESAIQEYNYGLDSIAGDEINNPIISSLLEGLKENARSEIIREAAEARLKKGE